MFAVPASNWRGSKVRRYADPTLIETVDSGPPAQTTVFLHARGVASNDMGTSDREIETAVSTARSEPADVGPAELALVLTGIEEGDETRRRSAAVGLAAVASESPESLLDELARIEQLLADEDQTVQAMAAAALSDVASAEPDAMAETAPALAARLDDDPLVRRHSLAALAYLADARPAAVEDAIPAVVSVLEERPTDPVIRGYTMATLIAHVRTHDTPRSVATAVPALLEFVDTAQTSTVAVDESDLPLEQEQEDIAVAETTTRNDALTVLTIAARDHPAEVAAHVESVAARLDAEDTPVRASMAETLQLVADEAPEAVRSAIEPLASCLGSNDTVAAAAMQALATIADHAPGAVADAVEPAVDHVIERLEHENDAVRAAATGLVAYLAEERPESVRSSVPTLVDRLDDGDPAVRGQAMWALAFLQADAALPVLDERADADPNPEIQSLAAEMATRIRTGERPSD